MYIIVGLGNPGKKYEGTRHNMGFDVIDRLVYKNNIPCSVSKFHSVYGTGMIGTQKVVLAKPLTYMNLSGTAVRELIVISDDIDLEPGRIRIRKQGSAGGQNGLRHIVQCLGTQKFIRIRVGTGGKPEGWELADWVLSRFTMDDRALVDDAIVRAADAVAAICTDGIDKAMNIYNVKA